MEEAVDGEYQDFKSKNGAYVRQHFFGKYPELLDMVADMSDDEVWALARGGHDPAKVYAAYAAAVEHTGQPTVILAKTVKGYGMGEAGEGQNITHQQKKMAENTLRAFRDRFGIDVPDDKIAELPYLRPAEDSPEMRYLRERREALGGYLPARRTKSQPLEVPPLSAFDSLLKGDRGARDLHHHGVRADAGHPAAGQEDRQADRADRAGRIAHLRHGGHVPPVRHLLPERAALPAGGRQPADVLPGGPDRPDAAGGHQRSRARCPPGSPRRPPTAPTTRR